MLQVLTLIMMMIMTMGINMNTITKKMTTAVDIRTTTPTWLPIFAAVSGFPWY